MERKARRRVGFFSYRSGEEVGGLSDNGEPI
jgi:hypothetical protein